MAGPFSVWMEANSWKRMKIEINLAFWAIVKKATFLVHFID